jgi:hypothetical protein
LTTHKEFIYSYGFDMKLAKYNFKNKTLDCTIAVESGMTALKVIKTIDENNKFKIATAFFNG